MTQKEFDALPMLLRAAQAMDALGCDRETLRLLREGAPNIAVQLPGMAENRYIKANIARLAKLEYR